MVDTTTVVACSVFSAWAMAYVAEKSGLIADDEFDLLHDASPISHSQYSVAIPST